MGDKRVDILRNEYGLTSGSQRDQLYNFLNQWVICYFEIYKRTDRLLLDFYTSYPQKRAEEGLPVPVSDIAEWLGFKIRRKSLNTTRNANLGLVLGRLEKTGDEWLIYLEEPYNLTYELEQYAIANLLGQYYVGRDAEFAECAEVRLPANNSEMMAMLFTSFLLLPPRDFFIAADNYADIKKRPIHQELMLLELSEKARIPYYYATICYEHLKILASYTRISNFSTVLQNFEKQTDPDGDNRPFQFPDFLAPEKFFY